MVAATAPTRSSTQAGTGSPAARWLWLAPALLGVLALLLRLYRLDGEPLWLDEGYTLLFSGLPLPRLITVGGAHEHPPLYYLLVHLLLRLHSWYLVPRVVSAVAGSLAVPLLYLLGRRLFGAVPGLVAAALLALSPFQVWYGQDGRDYELAGLCVILSYLLLLRALDGDGRGRWVLYALATAATLYTEYTTIFVLLPQALYLLPRGGRRPLLWSWAMVALAFLPWVGVLTLDAASIAANYWIPTPTPSTVTGTILEFLGLLTPCPSPPCTGTELAVPGLAGHEGVVALVLVGLVTLAGLYALYRRDLSLGVAVTWLLLPFGLVLLLAIRRSLYLDRIFLDATYALFLLVGWAVGMAAQRSRAPGGRRLPGRESAVVAPLVGARGCTHKGCDYGSDPARGGGSEVQQKRQPLRLIGVVGIIVALTMAVFGTFNLAPIYAGGVNPDWRTAARDFQAAYRPGQAVIFDPGVLQTLIHSYLPAGWHASEETALWSRVYLDVPGWQNRYPHPFAPNLAQRQAIEALLRDVQFSRAAHGRQEVWLLMQNYSGFNDARRWFDERGYQLLLSEMYRGDTRIELWSRNAPSSIGPPVVAPGFARWRMAGAVRLDHGVARGQGNVTLTRTFTVRPGAAYSAEIETDAIPPADKPVVSLTVYDREGRSLGVFPATKWYDWPVTGVWLQQPFGFVAPPGAVRAVLTLHVRWGTVSWRNIAVYRER